MKELKTVTTKTYDAGDGYLLDITQTPDLMTAYIYQPREQVKQLIIGMPAGDDKDYKFFVRMVKSGTEAAKADYFKKYLRKRNK